MTDTFQTTNAPALRPPMAPSPSQPSGLIADLFMLLDPPPLRRPWVLICLGLFAAAMAGLATAAYLGWRDYDWPAYLLQDGEWGTWLSAGPLFASGLIGLRTGIRSVGQMRRFWIIAGITLLIIGADDLWRLHENLELALITRFDLNGENFFVARINDAVIIAYGIAALIYTILRRHQLLRFPWACYCLAAGGIFFGAMVICDVFHISATLEESLKIVATILILSALLEVSARTTDISDRQSAA